MTQRRRYLSRRVEAQRDGHGGFYREGRGFAGAVGAALDNLAAKAVEARLAEFRVRAGIHIKWCRVQHSAG